MNNKYIDLNFNDHFVENKEESDYEEGLTVYNCTVKSSCIIEVVHSDNSSYGHTNSYEIIVTDKLSGNVIMCREEKDYTDYGCDFTCNIDVINDLRNEKQDNDCNDIEYWDELLGEEKPEWFKETEEKQKGK